MSGHSLENSAGLGKWENKEHPHGLDLPSPSDTIQLEAKQEVRKSPKQRETIFDLQMILKAKERKIYR